MKISFKKSFFCFVFVATSSIVASSAQQPDKKPVSLVSAISQAEQTAYDSCADACSFGYEKCSSLVNWLRENKQIKDNPEIAKGVAVAGAVLLAATCVRTHYQYKQEEWRKEHPKTVYAIEQCSWLVKPIVGWLVLRTAYRNGIVNSLAAVLNGAKEVWSKQ